MRVPIALLFSLFVVVESAHADCKWTFESAVWNGDLTFLSDGTYFTVWGKGLWKMDGHGGICLRNDYDPFQHYLRATDNPSTYEGIRSDGVKVKGRMNCGQLKDWEPEKLEMGDSLEEREVRQAYLDLLRREPDAQGFKYWLALRRAGTSIDDIREAFRRTPEYLKLPKSSAYAGVPDCSSLEAAFAPPVRSVSSSSRLK